MPCYDVDLGLIAFRLFLRDLRDADSDRCDVMINGDPAETESIYLTAARALLAPADNTEV